MEFPWSILAWIAGLIFVYFFGLFEGRGQGYKKRKADEEQEKKDQRVVPSAVAPEAKTVLVDDPGLLRIKNEGGSFALDLDGMRVNPSSLSPDQRKRLIDMLNVMRPWLEGRAAPATSMKPSSAAPSHPTSLSERL